MSETVGNPNARFTIVDPEGFITVTKPRTGEGTGRSKGMYDLACWNGLSKEQQATLICVGVLPFGYEPEGWCPHGAEVEIITVFDTAPGPRFYCLSCAVRYLQERLVRSFTGTT